MKNPLETTNAFGKPLRIGIVTDGLLEGTSTGTAHIRNGGVGVYIYNLVKHLQLIDHANEYFLIRRGSGVLDIYRNARTHCVFLRGSPLTRLGITAWRTLTHLGLDIVHFPNQFGGTFLPAQLKRVVTLHDLTPLLFPRLHPWRRVLGFRLLLRPALRRAHHVIVDSAHTRADLIQRGVVSTHKVTVVPLGTNQDFARSARTDGFQHRYDVPERYILNVGVLEPRKNHALLIAALRRLHDSGERVGLVIVGRDGWRWRDPRLQADAATLRPWVRIYRDVPDADLAEFYRRALAFAYPSLYEGFGLPVLEAMACGTPVVASRTSSLPEVFGDAALLADPTDTTEFAAQLLQVLRQPALRARLIAAGQERAAHLTWQRTAEQTLAVYQRVCGTVTDDCS
ncbi:MAG TPA: glycosyltransferase family 1 protein [Candidatus Margulisiibacteriota bacterium]|nr:glycosyltransferase family 1 protein [Candidatus Margulisiibacteriota bacterium]